MLLRNHSGLSELPAASGIRAASMVPDTEDDVEVLAFDADGDVEDLEEVILGPALCQSDGRPADRAEPPPAEPGRAGPGSSVRKDSLNEALTKAGWKIHMEVRATQRLKGNTGKKSFTVEKKTLGSIKGMLAGCLLVAFPEGTIRCENTKWLEQAMVKIIETVGWGRCPSPPPLSL